jgi:hypothetical protein
MRLIHCKISLHMIRVIATENMPKLLAGFSSLKPMAVRAFLFAVVPCVISKHSTDFSLAAK